MPADDILSLARQVGQSNPIKGWDWCAENTTFHADLMRESGRISPTLIECVGRNLVECLAAVGLKREDVVAAWMEGKDQAAADAKAAKFAEAVAKIKGKDAAKVAQLAVAEKAQPVIPSVVSAPPKESEVKPTLKPVPCRTDAPELKKVQKPKAKPAKVPAPKREQPSLF